MSERSPSQSSQRDSPGARKPSSAQSQRGDGKSGPARKASSSSQSSQRNSPVVVTASHISSRGHSPSSERTTPRRSSAAARPRGSSKSGFDAMAPPSTNVDGEVSPERSESPIFFPASPLLSARDRSPSPSQAMMMVETGMALHPIAEHALLSSDKTASSPMKVFAEKVISEATVAAFAALGAALPEAVSEEDDVAPEPSVVAVDVEEQPPSLLPDTAAEEETPIAAPDVAGEDAAAGTAAEEPPAEPDPASAPTQEPEPELPAWKKYSKRTGNVLDRITAAVHTGVGSVDIAQLELDTWPLEMLVVPDVRTVVAFKNLFTQVPSLADFHLLEVLDLSRNLLVSLDSADLHRLPRLKHLDVSRNALSALPDGLTKCVALEKLLCHRNELAGFPADMGQLRQLKVLDASHNRLVPAGLPASLEMLANLEELNLLFNDGLQAADFAPGPRTKRLVEKRANFASKLARREIIARALGVQTRVAVKERLLSEVQLP